MLDDFTPIVHKLDGRTIKVWAIADVHIGAKESNISAFTSLLGRVRNDDDSYVVLCGDIVNNGLKDSLTNVYEETMPPSAQIDLAVELLEPVKDKILGAVGGNHERRTKRNADIDIMLYICSLLKVPEIYRPNLAFIRVNLERGNTKDHYALLLAHGKTANKQKYFSYAIEGVDALICGHLHQGNIAKNAKLVFSASNTVSVKPFINMTATSFLSYGGYAAQSLMLPSATSDPQCLILEFTGSNAKQGRISVSW